MMRTTFFGLVAAIALTGQPLLGQSKALPGLNEKETEFLLCVTACERLFQTCTEENRIEVFRFFADVDEPRLGRANPEEVRAFLGCYTKRNACLKRCDR